MRRTEQLQGLRMLKLKDVLSRWEGSELSQLEAAELLGMSERTFRRWARRLEEEGEDGLIDRRLGRRSGRAVLDADRDDIERLYRERYSGFTATTTKRSIHLLPKPDNFRCSQHQAKFSSGVAPAPRASQGPNRA